VNLRRYDQILEFEAPSEAQVHNLITSNIAPLKAPHLAWEKIYTAAAGLSQAEIVRAVDDAVKTAILDDKNNLTTEDIVDRLQERHSMRTSSNWELING
jgi:AAA+ superfamily predicted ATPase